MQTIENKHASQFFFIRYADKKGEHIRLRFKGEQHSLQSIIKPLVLTTFQDYPIKFVQYIPEVKRYGGKFGVIIAEEQFEASSYVVLTLLAQNKTWSENRALGLALQLHIGMVFAIGMKKNEVINFFSHLVSERNVSTFDDYVNQQNTKILLQVYSLWKACEHNKQFKEQWFNKWIDDNKQVKQELDTAQQNQELEIADNPNHKMNPFWSLYESYIHMTNNRLGLSQVDEEYIAYVISRSLK